MRPTMPQCSCYSTEQISVRGQLRPGDFALMEQNDEISQSAYQFGPMWLMKLLLPVVRLSMHENHTRLRKVHTRYQSIAEDFVSGVIL